MAEFAGAVVGCGRMGAFPSDVIRRFAPACWLPLGHCEAMSAHPDIELSALCDIDSSALARAQAAYGVARTYSDYRQLLAEEKPDILCVATRTQERPLLIEHALRSGVRALHLEKPLCRSVAELLTLERALLDSDVACTYGTLRRYFPVYAHARALADSGRFGRLEQIIVSFGSAPLLWTHVHSLDLLKFMAGDAVVERVSARFDPAGIATSGTTIDADPVPVSILLEFANGTSGWIGRAGGSDVLLCCSKGTIAVESDGQRIRCRYGDEQSPYWDLVEEVAASTDERAAGLGGTLFALDRLVKALQGRRAAADVAADKRAIIDGQRLAFAAVQSHLEGGVAVDPQSLDPRLVVTGRSGTRFA
jgi:predicted dehydrogenase